MHPQPTPISKTDDGFLYVKSLIKVYVSHSVPKNMLGEKT